MNKINIQNSKLTNIILYCVISISVLYQICFFFKVINPEIVSNPYLHTQKISITIFIASFIFFFQNKYWPIVLSVLINLWGISNIIYYRANGILIDAYSITMIGNMNGFWSSVPFYIELSDFTCFFATAITTISCIFLNNKQKSYILGLLSILLSVSINIYACEKKMKRANPNHKMFESIRYYNPLSVNKNLYIGFDSFTYSQELSIIHHFVYHVNYFIKKVVFQQEYQLMASEISLIKQFTPPYSQKLQPSTPLIIILVESLENWVITPTTTPNLYNFIQNNYNLLYASKITSQTRGGTSADGQMIVNTGILPIKEGAVCYRFPYNTFPAISKLYSSSCNIIPGGQSVWNQKYMNIAYGIKESYTIKQNETSTWGDDASIFQQYTKIHGQHDYSMVLTISTHSPFHSTAEKSSLKLPVDMPKDMANYMKSFHYTDSCMQGILNNINNDSILKHSTIVITSDHSIFPPNKREDYSLYCTTNNFNYAINEPYCPLIIYSPNIKNKTIINDIAYQMDIYPTILNVIDCENYYFKGFGVNLLDENFNNKRQISAEEAFELSDKLMRSNYFKTLENN